MAPTSFQLNTGAKIPAVGLGTWQSSPGEVKNAVLTALKAGYRHVDCAYIYGNENEVGEALAEAFKSGICKREDVFITTKLWNSYHNRPAENLEKSLKLLQLDYVDLYLMHWPVPFNPNGNDEKFPKHPDGSRDILAPEQWSHVQTWQGMEKLVEGGKVRALGVSNYSIPYLEELLKVAKIVPAANQIENHPYLPQDDLVKFCEDKGIIIEAYSPLGSTGSPLFKEKGVVEVSQKRGVSEGTVLLSYAVARGIVVLPKSVTPARIEANFKIIDLDAEDMKSLKSVSANGINRFIWPPFNSSLGFPDKIDSEPFYPGQKAAA